MLNENKRKKRYKRRKEEEKAKEESLRIAKEENERKYLAEREKIKQESNFEIQSQVIELKIISNAKRKLIVKDLVLKFSLVPSIQFQFSKEILTSLNSILFVSKSFVLLPSQTFCSQSLSLNSSSSASCVKTHFDSKILFKNHLSPSVQHSFCEVGLIPTFSKFISPFSHSPH